MKALTTPRRGRRGPTIYEVAERAGVSIATVSRVQRRPTKVAGMTRDRVLAAMEELSYRPSAAGRSLARGLHDAVGIVFPDLSGPYYSAVILGYEEASAAEGRSAVILATHRRASAVEQVLDLADRVDGLVLMGGTVDDAVVERISDRSVPVVLLARPPAGKADSVRVDNRGPARELVTHLFAHGHRRIVFVGAPAASPDVAERWDGFAAAHRAAEVPVEPPLECGYRVADGQRAGKELLARSARPTAIVAANDEIALGLLDAARSEGVAVPGGVAITGWDDIGAARMVTPALTTVRQPATELGRRAAELLNERITNQRTEPRHELLPTVLVVRASCGCPNQTSEGERTP